MGEVDADLVLAARLELDLEERGARAAVSRTRQCVRAGCDASPGRATARRPLTHASRSGASTVPLSRGRLALHDREVAALDPVVRGRSR